MTPNLQKLAQIQRDFYKLNLPLGHPTMFEKMILQVLDLTCSLRIKAKAEDPLIEV